MKGIMLLNGEPHAGEIPCGDAYVLCCDGAYAWAKGRVRIDENIGDYDSSDDVPDPPPSEIYPSEKDYTDGEIGMRRLLALGCCPIEIYGGGGGREDHFLGNVHLLYIASQMGVPARLHTNGAVIFLAKGYAAIARESGIREIEGLTVSLLPFGGEARISDGEGLYYPVGGRTLRYGSTLGISNLITDNGAWFVCESGTVLTLLDRDRQEKKKIPG